MRVAADNLELLVAEEEAKEPPLGQVQMLNQHSESVDLSNRSVECSQRSSEEQKSSIQKENPRMVMESPILSQNQNPHQPEEEQKVELLPRR